MTIISMITLSALGLIGLAASRAQKLEQQKSLVPVHIHTGRR